METSILVAGLPLKVRARLQGLLSDIELVTARTPQEFTSRLQTESLSAVVVSESFVQGPILEFLEQLGKLFHGIVIFCAAGQHDANELRQMVQRHHVAVILQEPIDPAELVRSLAVQLGLQTRSAGTRTTHSEEVQLDQVYAEHRGLLDERLTSLERLQAGAGEAELEEAWRAAHHLVGTLGSFGIDKGTLLAREAVSLLKIAVDGGAFQSERLHKIVAVLRSLVGSHRSPSSATWADSVVVVVSDDEEFLELFEVEALLQNWLVTVCDDLSNLSRILGETEARAVLLDQDSGAARNHPELVEELLHDAVPCVVLSSVGAPRGLANHLVWLTRPIGAYEAVGALLRTQVTPAPANPPGILVVDDDKIILKVVSNMLSKIDLYVQTLRSPLEFWDALEQMKPDLVILDVDLPPLGGVELCRALRADPRHAALPVIFLSSYNDAETLQKCYQAGGDDYMYKPVSGLELTTRVTNRLERTRQIAARPLPAQQPVYPYSSLDQLLLRSLREDVPACLLRIEVPASADEFEAQAILNRVQRLLRKSLRGEDVVKPLGPLELLVGMAGVDRYKAERRVDSILERHLQAIRVGIAEFPQDGTDLGALIEQARPKAPAASSS